MPMAGCNRDVGDPESDAVAEIDAAEFLDYRQVENGRVKFDHAQILRSPLYREYVDVLQAADRVAQFLYRQPKLSGVRCCRQSI